MTLSRGFWNRQRWMPIILLSALAVGGPARASSGGDTLYVTRGYVHSFRLINQQGKEVTLDQLRGKVWIASFFFSTCTECNKSTLQQLERVQKAIAGWPDIVIVSFSVFPERDTVEQLQRFAEAKGIDPDRWWLLTTPPENKAALYKLIQQSFEQPVAENPEPSPGAEIGHSFRFLLVDSHGRIRGYVDGKNPTEVDRLVTRAKELVLGKYLPTVNASLNALSGLLLLCGFVAVKLRRIRLHKGLMLSALLASAVFLACYLYYHFAVQRGEPTAFQGEGVVRIVYFGVLISHTVLAAVVAPAALWVVWLGVRNRLERHKAVARWVLPVWLYVSATGVVVYWMLYVLFPPGQAG